MTQYCHFQLVSVWKLGGISGAAYLILLTNCKYVSFGLEGLISSLHGLQGRMLEIDCHGDAIDKPLD